jgi:hypothetical protein
MSCIRSVWLLYHKRLLTNFACALSAVRLKLQLDETLLEQQQAAYGGPADSVEDEVDDNAQNGLKRKNEASDEAKEVCVLKRWSWY